jgi:hypothetical protein
MMDEVQELIPVEGHTHLGRDPHSNAKDIKLISMLEIETAKKKKKLLNCVQKLTN